MARNLYRVYLYVVFVGMLIFAAIGLGSLLSTLLTETALRGANAAPPTQAQVVQSVTFAVVAWLVAGVIGGFHYWLIRRDMEHYPQAGASAIRSFFLNVFEALAVVIGVSLAVSAVGQLAYAPIPVASELAAALAAVGLVAILEWERQRARPGPGAATVLQRLHLFGVPLVIVLATTASWQDALRQTTLDVLGRAPSTQPYGYYGYAEPLLWPLWVAVLLSAVCWTVYRLLTRSEPFSLLREVISLLGFGYGMALAVAGAVRAVELAVRTVTAVPTTTAAVAECSAALLFGALVAAVYGMLLFSAPAEAPVSRTSTRLTAEAVAAAILAVPFWWGGGLALHNLIENTVANAARTSPSDTAFALALLITGVIYIPLAVHLRVRGIQSNSLAPRRAFVLTLLAAGIIVAAVGAAVALYALGTSVLGAPITDWQQTARTAAVAFVTGGILAALYGGMAAREHAFGALRLPATHAPAKPTQPRDEIDVLLADFAAGKITQEAAAQRLRELTRVRA